MILLLALLGCDTVSRADYERLERRVEALEARAREDAQAKADAARAAEAQQVVDDKESQARRVLAELQLINRPAPPLRVSRWLDGKGELGTKPTLLLFFPVGVDTAELARIQTLANRRASVVGIAATGFVEPDAWLLHAHPGFPVALDDDGATARAYARPATPSAVLVKGGNIVWTGSFAGLDAGVLAKHL